MVYEYKMVPVPHTMQAEYGKDPSEAIAKFMEKLTNDMAQEGWEFHRVDLFNIAQLPGCLAAFAGGKESISSYNVVCFRRNK